GCAILSASLFDWAQNLRAAEAGYAWVRADATIAPAAETAEIWQVAASCVRPFFVNAVLQSKLALNNHYAMAPEAVRAWHARPTDEGLAPAADQKAGLYRLINGRQDGSGQNSAQMERGAMLHVRYAEWYANLFKLEVQAHEWERRLADIADQSVTVSEATRKSFGAYAGRGVERAGSQGDFDHYLFVLLGLGGFANDQEQAIRTDCVEFIPVKRVFKSANYLGEVWQWPVDHAAAFSFGLELVLIGILFIPIDLWIATGDIQAVRRHIAEVVTRLATSVFTLARTLASRLLKVLYTVLRAVVLGARAIFTANIKSGRAVGQIPLVAKLAEIRLPRRLAQIAAGNVLGKTIEWLKRTERDEPAPLRLSHLFVEND
ncbi:MAG: hypothetical protein WA889_16410, partial [Xanthobacteraceae bacterium]